MFEKLHWLQILGFALFMFQSVFLFFFSWWKRKKIILGNVETSLLPGTVAFLGVKYFSFPFTDNLYLLWFAIVLFIAGTIFGKVAFKYLGWVNSDDFWLGRHEKRDRILAQSGPYQYIRHPIYTGMLMQYLGFVLLFLNIWSVIGYIFALVFIIVTAIHEEKFLLKRFPEYREYMNTTGRFLPKI
jgi:protein-S-isoprenylcysteine O-methyltransferase Ste14